LNLLAVVIKQKIYDPDPVPMALEVLEKTERILLFMVGESRNTTRATKTSTIISHIGLNANVITANYPNTNAFVLIFVFY